ncbi:unnamed protein product [Heligmosomoides polygyrus]|uniref:TNFR-Cys domain-containing protein n=1 Tax=Heligmosomoides polygyrus TaxID=6339 RepID=A0A3P7XDT9_HELPZ|nr:unnamed protein product [Heligmosomoides polygyrus]
MRTILATLLFVFVIATDIVYTLDDDVFKLCSEGDFYDDNMEGCEPCSTCKDNYYVRQACSTFKNTVCGWCGSSKPVKNRDFYKRCHVSRLQDSLEEKHFEKDFRQRVMASIMKEKHMKVNDEAIEKEQQHPDRRRLPPLPTDEYDEEYPDQDDEKYDVPASEEDLEGLVSLSSFR